MFLLNFPKIKKVLTDEHKLAQYLENDPKYEGRNFVIDPVLKTIRKKLPGEGSLQPEEK